MASTRPARILVVCTGNICRSPMAEALLRAWFDRHLDDPAAVEVSSAGVHARTGDPASSGMQAVATDWGVPLQSHWSQPVTPELVEAQDLVLTMEAMHRQRVGQLAPGAGARTFLFTEAADLAATVDQDTSTIDPHGLDVGPARPDGPSARLGAFVRQLQQLRTRHSPSAEDVEDPYGRSHQEYLACAWQLADLVEILGTAMTRALAPPRP